MNLTPIWKVKRELQRLRTNAWRAIRGTLIEPPRQWLHDQQTRHGQGLTPGRLPLTERVAVFVLFQPQGLAGSVRLTLEHLASEGWSVLVVSNGTLSTHDAEMVTDNAALLLQRPNVGYDFGGYRAGLRLLKQKKLQPYQLILINDSTWFPLRESDDTLRRLESLGAAMSGQIFKTEKRRSQDHLESHLLMFSSRALTHPSWTRFWDNFVMSDDRVTTIARGEKGLSQALMSAGLNVAGLISRESLLNCLGGLSDTQLRGVMADVVHHRTDAQAHCAAMASSSAWRAEFLDWVANALANSRQHLVSATFVAPAMELCGMGFLKKTRDRRFHLARLKLLELESTGRIAPLHPVVRAEIEASVGRWKAPPE